MSVKTKQFNDGDLVLRFDSEAAIVSIHRLATNSRKGMGRVIDPYTRIPTDIWPFSEATRVVYRGYCGEEDPRQRFEVTDTNGETKLVYGNNKTVNQPVMS